jgi:integrase/recombinase XerD
MIEDMSVRHFASKTQHDYIRTVMKLTILGRSPDTATYEDLRRFQLHLYAKTFLGGYRTLIRL